MTVQKTRVGHVDQASQITVEPVGSVTKTNVQGALEQLTGLVTPNDAEFVTGASNVALPNALVLTDTATVTWDLSTPNQAKANAAGGSSSDSFKTISVSGQSDVVADSSTDTLTLVAGSNVTITTDAGTDTVTISASGAALSDGDYGDITASGSGTALNIDPGAVTYAKLQDASAGNVVLARAASTSGDYGEVALAASQLLGRGDSGDVAAITLGTNLSMAGTTLNASQGLTRGQAVALSANMDWR